MIVYNVGRRFFAKKNDAAAHRRAHGQFGRPTVHKITINNREELAAFLDGLCAPGPDKPSPLPDTAVERYVPDYVPLFLRKDWEKRS